MNDSDKTEIVLRPAVPDDFDALARLWLESWRSTGLSVTESATEEANRERIDAELADGWEITVAAMGNRLVGFLAIKPKGSYLDQLFVAPDMKRSGVGTMLISHAKRRMPNGFTLHSAVESEEACSFYERSGLIRLRTERHSLLGHLIAIYRWKQDPIPDDGIPN